MARRRSVPLAQLKDTALNRVRRHTGGKLTHDDATVLAVEIERH